jgi:hypothetical protein
MFRLYLSHLQALKGQIHTISRTMHCGIPNTYNKLIVKHRNRACGSTNGLSVYCKCWDRTMHCSTYCMDLTIEGLKMTQVGSKHVALLT